MIILLIGLTEKEKIYFMLFSNLLLEMYSILYLIKSTNSRDKKCNRIMNENWKNIIGGTFYVPKWYK